MPIQNNEKGITLVEVLAVLVLSSIVAVLLFNIFTQGQKSYVQSTENINLEQQTQIIIENIRNKHLHTDGYKLLVQENALKLDNKIISEGFTYEVKINNNPTELNRLIEIDTSDPTILDITLLKNKKSYNARTVLEKWQ